jgi:8-oxo-dGTP diphosphatase
LSVTHDYPDRSVELHFLRCDLKGDPSPQQGQEMQWVLRTELKELQFPPADIALIRTLGDESA